MSSSYPVNDSVSPDGYDIFISYRHKDNHPSPESFGRHVGWVTEFVDALKIELESTFKENITVYFDENELDGIRETDQVNESLNKKLRCLIFVPVISRTYCDPNSYAWKHELSEFVRMAAEESRGTTVNLLNGNVCSRIIPIRIHDTSSEDEELYEKTTGNKLRAIDFVYRSSGVNRALLPSDDPNKNFDGTYYLDQVNKLAICIKDVIDAITHPSEKPYSEKPHMEEPFKAASAPKKNTTSKTVLSIIGVFVLALITLSYFWYSNSKKNASLSAEKSIAVLPFKNLSSNEENQYFADAVRMDVLNLLSLLDGFDKVISERSSDYYHNQSLSIPQIAKELSVNYIMTGSVQKVNDQVRVVVQLIDAKTDNQIWSNDYQYQFDDPFNVQTIIAREIAGKLNAELSGKDERTIQGQQTSNRESWELYQRARKYYYRFNIPDMLSAVELFKESIKLDSGFILPYSGLSNAFSQLAQKSFLKDAWLDSARLYADFMKSKAPELSAGYKSMGLYYSVKGDLEKAIAEYKKAILIDSNLDASINLARIYYRTGSPDQSVTLLQSIITQHPMDENLFFSLGAAFYRLDDFPRAHQFLDQALKINPNHINSLLLKWMLCLLEDLPAEASAIASRLELLGGNTTSGLFSILSDIFNSKGNPQGLMNIQMPASITGNEYDYIGLPYLFNLFCYYYHNHDEVFKSDSMAYNKVQVLRYKIATGEKAYQNAYEMAQIFSLKGEKDSTLKWMNKAIEFGWTEHRYFERDPLFTFSSDKDIQMEFIDIARQKVDSLRENVDIY